MMMLWWGMEIATLCLLFASSLSSPHQYFLFLCQGRCTMDMHVRRGVACLILQRPLHERGSFPLCRRPGRGPGSCGG
jgi:hypothetical protein